MFIKSYDFKAAIRASLPSCTDSGFFMGERKVNKKIILKGFGYSLMTISGFFSLSALGLHGLSKVGGFVGVAGFKYGEAAFATEAAEEFAQENYHKGLGYLGLCVLLFIISVSAATIYLFGEDKKDLVQYQEAKAFLETKEKDVIDAKAQRAACNPSHVTKCVKPLSELVAQKEAERDQAAKQLSKFTDAEGINQTWKDLSVWAGFQGENDANDLHIERNVIIAALWDFIAMMFIVMSEKKDKQPKEEVKKTTSGRRDDDFFEPDFNDYKQSERTFNREPVKAPVNYQPTNDWQSFSFEEEKKDVVKFIMDLPAGRSVAILGQSGFGKSSLLGHLGIEALNRGHQVFAIDPHFNITESSFDPRCQIIGKSANGMAEIKNFIFWLKKELDKREMELKTIPYVFDSWPTYVVLMDEMFEVINAAGLTKEFAVMYTKMRKYKIVFLGISQSFNVKSMGVEGNQDLLKTFEIFQLSGASDDYKITHAVLDDNGKKRIVKGIFDHPGEIKFSHIPGGKEQPDFKQTIKNIVTPNVKNLKKLNGDIFPA